MARRAMLLDASTEVVEKKKSRKGLFIGIGILAATPILGSTLAASISLGSSAIEFGQGSIAVTACDTEVTVTPVASFDPGTGANGTFYLDKFTVTGVDEACVGKTMTLNAWETDNSTQYVLGSDGQMFLSHEVTNDDITDGVGTFDLTVVGNISSSDLGKITLESS